MIEKLKNENQEKEKINQEKEELLKKIENEKQEKEIIIKEKQELITKIENEKQEKGRIIQEKQEIEKKQVQYETEIEKLKNELSNNISIKEMESKLKQSNENLEKEREKISKLEEEKKELLLKLENIEKEKKEKEETKKEKEEKTEEETKKEQLDISEEKNKLEEEFQNYKNIIEELTEDIQNQETFIESYNSFSNQLNSNIINVKNNVKISMNGKPVEENKENEIEKQNILQELQTVSEKVKNFSDIIDKIKDRLKKIERIYGIIQRNFSEMNSDIKLKDSLMENIFGGNTEATKKQLEKLKTIIDDLKNRVNSYKDLRSDIEKSKEELKTKGENYKNKIKKAQDNIFDSILGILKKAMGNKYGQIEKFLNLDEDFKGNVNYEIHQYTSNDNFALSKLSDLFKDFNSKKNKIKEIKENSESSNEEIEEDLDSSNKEINKEIKESVEESKSVRYALLNKNWNEVCYIYDDYDIHEVNYELKAVGLPKGSSFNRTSFGFIIGKKIEILEFKIDGKSSEYNYDYYSLSFDINLHNEQSNKIFIKYKQAEKDLTEEKKKQRKLYRKDYYGIYGVQNSIGEKGSYTLILKSDLEIIDFKDDIFNKINDKKYTWEGNIPEGGKRTLISFSSKTAHFNFKFTEKVSSLTNMNLKNTTLKIPFGFEGGNNTIKNMEHFSEQTKQIERNMENHEYIVKFENTNFKIGEFVLKGEFANTCKGAWQCYLTEQQIEDSIPEDFKSNKKMFKQISEDIIKEYNKEHKDETKKVSDLVKIGKWVNKNIKYNITFSGKNNITATETYKLKQGVCHHFTKLFNALMYSLGYQVIYVGGYAIKDDIAFSDDDGHAWSLIKVNGEWLPFDSTWGIFSGKLPLCHVFGHFNNNGTRFITTDSLRISHSSIEGKFIDN